jgi:hypothetical protein
VKDYDEVAVLCAWCHAKGLRTVAAIAYREYPALSGADGRQLYDSLGWSLDRGWRLLIHRRLSQIRSGVIGRSELIGPTHIGSGAVMSEPVPSHPVRPFGSRLALEPEAMETVKLGRCRSSTCRRELEGVPADQLMEKIVNALKHPPRGKREVHVR